MDNEAKVDTAAEMLEGILELLVSNKDEDEASRLGSFARAVLRRAPSDFFRGRTDADLVELVSRLRSQAPRMPLVLMYEEGSDRPPDCDGVGAVVARPPSQALGRENPKVEAPGQVLQEALAPWSRKGGS